MLLAFAGLTALVSQEVSWGERAQGGALPAVVMNRIAGAPGYTMTGPEGLDMALVQVDSWGLTFSDAKLTARQVKAALAARSDARFTGLFLQAERDDVTPAAEGQPAVFRTSLDVRVWFLES